jgi:UDP-N-acetylmuramate: L-alanyl-gamma-D-glutamyl-meso-diaminopimelate ligase
MPKEYFTVANARSLRSVSVGGSIHVIGVSGVAMAQLAVALAAKGYQVSGSDKDFYEPMGSFLAQSPVRLFRGYAAENVHKDLDLVVIGNAVSYGHVEVDAVEALQLPYTLFPKLLHELAIEGRHSIVVAGTHGKTTTTALAASSLIELGDKPSFFIGGAVPGFPTSLVAGAGGYSVVEGDEYDSAFFAKVPKFSFYQPETLILTSIEYDHADIYPSLDAINQEFSKLVLSRSRSARVIACGDDSNLQQLIADWRKRALCEILTYGISSAVDVQTSVTFNAGFPAVSLRYRSGAEYQFKLQIPGKHNALNAAAVFVALTQNGFSPEAVSGALQKFRGVRRRQEVRYEGEGVILIDDFAHHPTAVRETLAAIRSRYPGKKLWAVFEPRSNTSRRKVFQQEYVEAFRTADQVLLCDVTVRSIDPLDQLLDVRSLGNDIVEAGVPAQTLPDSDAIYRHLESSVGSNDLVLVMSNGGFGGLVQRLATGFAERVKRS